MSDEEEVKRLWVLDSVKSLGVPTVFLCILLFMIWQAGAWTGSEVVVPLFKKQMEFIDNASKVTDNMSKAMIQIEQTLEEHEHHGKVVVSEIEESRKEVLVNREILKTMNDLNVKNNTEQITVLKKIEENTSHRP